MQQWENDIERRNKRTESNTSHSAQSNTSHSAQSSTSHSAIIPKKIPLELGWARTLASVLSYGK